MAPAAAQEWPTRPVTMVVTFAAGGPNDTVARILAPRMSEVLGQQVIIENVGGAGGMVGSYRVAKAPPDGYQFVYGSIATHAQNQSTRSLCITLRPISRRLVCSLRPPNR